MQIPIRMTGDRIDEWVIIELQGALESSLGGDLSGKEIGTLSYTKEGAPVLIVGHHALFGKEVVLDKPLGVLVKKQQQQQQESQEQCAPAFDIVASVKRKIVFKSRPRPIVTQK
uniref:Chromosome transmission fidelity protein 8 homolog n=1 Tax=Plectus sambesii TaxID=2011161 RepID=A0A914W5Z8_9BILA